MNNFFLFKFVFGLLQADNSAEAMALIDKDPLGCALSILVIFVILFVLLPQLGKIKKALD